MSPAVLKPHASHLRLWLLLLVCVSLNIATWFMFRETRAVWGNTPPAPSQHGLNAFALGDSQMAYRASGLMLQNLGNMGGETKSLQAYDYAALKNWFFLMDTLDPRANFLPFLASYYFGAVDEPDKVTRVVDFLEIAGDRPGNNKWPWLAHAVYLSRYVLKDMNRAYELANKLAALAERDPSVPAWGRQMPAFVLSAQGDKQGALAIMLEILNSSATKMPPQEINSIRHYICERIMTPAEAQENTLCKDLK